MPRVFLCAPGLSGAAGVHASDSGPSRLGVHRDVTWVARLTRRDRADHRRSDGRTGTNVARTLAYETPAKCGHGGLRAIGRRKFHKNVGDVALDCPKTEGQPFRNLGIAYTLGD